MPIKRFIFILEYFQMNEMFVDTKNMAIVKKMVKPRDQQGEFESRRSVNVTIQAVGRKNGKSNDDNSSVTWF